MNRLYLYILGILLTALLACSRNADSDTATPMPVERIDLFIDNYPSSAPELESLQPGLGLYLELMTGNATTCDSTLLTLHESPVTAVFGKDIRERFTQSDSLALPLGRTIKRLESLLPEVNVTNVYGIASPYMQSVIVSDSIVMIALNHYLGSDYAGYSSMPEYRRRLKTASRVPADVAEALVRINYPYHPTDGTLLERMLYEGAVLRAVSEALGVDAATASGMSSDEYQTVKNNSREIWEALATERLLYTTSDADISRLTLPAPFSTIGKMQLRARAANIIGLEIIDSYTRENPDTDMQRILSPEFYGKAQQRLIESRFNP